MAVVYLHDHASKHQAQQWRDYRQKLNPFLTVTFAFICILYVTGAFEFNAITAFMGFTVFLKLICHFRIKEYENADKTAGENHED
tara:strand:+ start:1197 stop:1451 length:255 start_codon:yes stop_codon:yes gene_type:complete